MRTGFIFYRCKGFFFEEAMINEHNTVREILFLCFLESIAWSMGYKWHWHV
jgi:hypothetical protein